MDEPQIAYFSMEIGLEDGLPTYAGGLGILAGDTIRAAADLGIPMVAVTLLHRKGYFYQTLDAEGGQVETPVEWPIDDFLREEAPRIRLEVSGRSVRVRSWSREVKGVKGHVVPVYFLDTDLPENDPEARTLTHFLYGGDRRYRLLQEIVLGFGGLRMLRALGYGTIRRFHMNEGHSSLLTLGLLDERIEEAGATAASPKDVGAVRNLCVFTTHTPVPAGHDRFPLELVRQVLDHHALERFRDLCCFEGELNMTYLALNFSRYINGVAKRHGEVTQHLFARYTVDAITNGVHAPTWVSPPVATLFDRYIPGWREDNFSLRSALGIPADQVWQAHFRAKRDLVDLVNHSTNAGMDVDHLTLGFARRATSYKRPGLIFRDLQRLRQIAAEVGPLQLVFAGKAHPADEPGKETIRRVFEARKELGKHVRVAWLENYDLQVARRIIPGVDVWLNTPEPPHEASGTSGMKAAINGVPSLSVLDGWWLEGHIEGVTGWAVEDPPGNPGGADLAAAHARSLHDKLHERIAPLFYGDRDGFVDVMRHVIALNGSFFNTQRMLQQYLLRAYFPV